MISVLNCNALQIPLADGSVQCVVTSPPYWGLRNYDTPGQLGLEPTPDEYVANMVRVFREVKRVLRDDGVLWLNLGDSYATQPAGNKTPSGFQQKSNAGQTGALAQMNNRIKPNFGYLKPKNLVGIPWHVAFALQADGWWLRSDVIWSKPNPMPESVTDRPTKAHEYVFLLSKSARYYYDATAVREPTISVERAREKRNGESAVDTKLRGHGSHCGTYHTGRNLRTVWTIATQPYKGAHFACYPEKLVEPCIKAGTSERGCCPVCGAPWERVVNVDYEELDAISPNDKGWNDAQENNKTTRKHGRARKLVDTIGWKSTCTHDSEPVPCVVLDPFAGSGTTGRVAARLNRSFVGLELKPEYIELARERMCEVQMNLC